MKGLKRGKKLSSESHAEKYLLLYVDVVVCRPLSDGKVLKSKFDEIFAATRSVVLPLVPHNGSRGRWKWIQFFFVKNEVSWLAFRIIFLQSCLQVHQGVGEYSQVSP